MPPRFSAPETEDTLENRIGSQWLNRIGIIAVLVGVAYFLKLAFESNWIGPGGRILIGLCAGLGVIAWSERFRRRGYRAFAHSLKAVGFGALYLSLWGAFQLYHLLPAGAAFAGMVLITAAMLAMALRENGQVLGTMALVGGFVTPALVSTGENHEVFLFCYIALLSAAAVWFALQKRWHAALLTAWAGTWGYYIAWNSDFYTPEQLPLTAVFAAVFIGLYLAPPLRLRSGAGERSMTVLLLLHAAAGFAAFYALLADRRAYGDAAAWTTFALALLYFALSRWAWSEQIRWAHVGAGVALITASVALGWHGAFITLGWLIEAAVLLLVAARIRSRVLGVMASSVLLLGIFRLTVVDQFAPDRPFWNLRALLFAIAIALLALLVRSMRASRSFDGMWQAASCLLTFLALLGLDKELAFAILPYGVAPARQEHSAAIVLNFARSALWMAYGAGCMLLGFIKRVAFFRWQALVILAVTICKVFVYDIEQLNQGYRVVSFIGLGVILLGVSYAYQKDWLRLGEVSAAPAPPR